MGKAGGRLGMGKAGGRLEGGWEFTRCSISQMSLDCLTFGHAIHDHHQFRHHKLQVTPPYMAAR